jgi:uncharacterized LabA/DUF88 family protein
MRVAVLVDTPNITKSVRRMHGEARRADYREVLQLASELGTVVCAKALVNDGLPQHQVIRLHNAGLTVVRSHSFDCDEALVAWAVRIHAQVDCLLLCSGDKHFRSLMQLLQSVGRKVVVCAVTGSCNVDLKARSNQYLEMPVVSRPTQAGPALLAGAGQAGC